MAGKLFHLSELPFLVSAKGGGWEGVTETQLVTSPRRGLQTPAVTVRTRRRRMLMDDGDTVYAGMMPDHSSLITDTGYATISNTTKVSMLHTAECMSHSCHMLT